MKIRMMRVVAVLLALVVLVPTLSEHWIMFDEVQAYNEQTVKKRKSRLMAGDTAAGVIAADGKLYAWGSSYYPEDDYSVESNIPMIPSQAKRLENIYTGTMGHGSVGIILEDKTLHTFGWNASGMCGNGENADNRACQQVFENVRSISMGNSATMIVTYDNELYGCGSDRYGQMGGTGDGLVTLRPVKIMDNIKTACIGGNTVAAITTDGDLYMWGDNVYRKLTTEDKDFRAEAKKIEGLENVVSVSVGSHNVAAITEDGSLYTWGCSLGRGHGDYKIPTSQPEKIMDNVVSVCLGNNVGAAITEDGSLFTWGDGSDGQIGNGDNTSSTTPVKIMDDVEEVVWGRNMGIALTKDGDVWTWGKNKYDQLGTGDNEDSNVPINVFNIYTGICEGKKYIYPNSKVYRFGYDMNNYSQNLAEISALYSMLAYDEYRVSKKGQYYVAENGRSKRPRLLIEQLYKDGFYDVSPSKSYGDKEQHNCSYTFASRLINYNGETKNQILITIRGTDGVEWEGNMKLTGTRYAERYKDTHFSFEQAKEEILKDLEAYIITLQKKGIDTEESVIWVTGHSRGGAVANLLAVDLTDLSSERMDLGDVFGYSFATANATTLYTEKKYSNIYNHCFEDDFVPNVPLESWGYGNYGETLVATAETLYDSNPLFASNMKSFVSSCSSKRKEAQFNMLSTSSLIKHMETYWKSTEDYYKIYITDSEVDFNTSLYMLLNNVIAKLAQNNISDFEKNKAYTLGLKCYTNNLLRPVIAFFIKGQKFNKNINDTHQAYTYYLATKLGAFQFVFQHPGDITSDDTLEQVSGSENSETEFQIKDRAEQGAIAPENNVSGNNIQMQSVSENAVPSIETKETTLSGNSISGNDININVNEENTSQTALTKEEEKQRLINFVNQENNNENLGWDVEDATTWKGVSFDEEGYISKLDLSYKYLTGKLDLSGFSHLTTLDCSGNNLTSIDVTNCIALEKIDCYFNTSLQELLVKGCVRLTYINCYMGEIQTVDLSDCISLEELVCSNNQLEMLDLTSLSKLSKLHCDSNKITEIVIPASNQLKNVNCEYNYLTDFTVWELLAQNEENRILYLEQNVPDGANFSETDISILTQMANTGSNLEKLGWNLSKPQEWYGVSWKYDNGIYYVDEISLTSGSLEGKIKISDLSKLEMLNLSENQIAELTVENCPELQRITCVDTGLEMLEINDCPMLSEIYAYYNYLSQENVAKIEVDYKQGENILELSPQYLKAKSDEFAKEDVETVLNFANLEENKDNIYFDQENPGSWDAVTWEKQADGLYHIVKLEFEKEWISGKFDMSNLKYLKDYCFASTNITEVVLPKTMEEVPVRAFFECQLLKELTIPENIKKINDLAFARCNNLSQICFYSKNAEIGSNSFYDSIGIKEITCYANATESAYPYEGQPEFTYWQTKEDPVQKTEEKKNSDETKKDTKNQGKTGNNKTTLKVGDKKTVGNAVYKITKMNSKVKNVSYVKCTNKQAKTITIRSTIVIDGMVFKVTAIEKNAFKNMKKLQKVTIGKYVKTIGDKAFYKCSKLKKIQIKSTALKKIGKNALKGIYKKAVIKVPKSKKKIYKKLLVKKKVGLPKKATIK